MTFPNAILPREQLRCEHGVGLWDLCPACMQARYDEHVADLLGRERSPSGTGPSPRPMPSIWPTWTRRYRSGSEGG